MVYKVEFGSLWHRALHDYVNFINFVVCINVILMLILNFTVMLSYCVICVFLVHIVYYPVATHEHAT
jgi:hypothetical protein